MSCTSSPKSISPPELSAQIRALLRLRHNYTSSTKATCKDLEADFTLQKIKVHGNEVKLRKKEYSILEYLFLNRGRIVSKEELLDHIWEEGILVQSNSLEVHMRNLRVKIERPYSLEIIKTIRGFGYKIE